MVWPKDRLTRFEVTRIIGARALQLAMGAPLLLELSEKELEKINYNTIEIAKIEFERDILPITIKRPLPEKV